MTPDRSSTSCVSTWYVQNIMDIIEVGGDLFIYSQENVWIKISDIRIQVLRLKFDSKYAVVVVS